jgi:hypothetical protein
LSITWLDDVFDAITVDRGEWASDHSTDCSPRVV